MKYGVFKTTNVVDTNHIMTVNWILIRLLSSLWKPALICRFRVFQNVRAIKIFMMDIIITETPVINTPYIKSMMKLTRSNAAILPQMLVVSVW